MNWHADHNKMKNNIIIDPLIFSAGLFESRLILTQDQKLTKVFVVN